MCLKLDTCHHNTIGYPHQRPQEGPYGSEEKGRQEEGRQEKGRQEEGRQAQEEGLIAHLSVRPERRGTGSQVRAESRQGSRSKFGRLTRWRSHRGPSAARCPSGPA